MPIEYIKGDVFASPEALIVHGCNAQGVMGSGVAAIVRRDFPKAYEEYKSWHKSTVDYEGQGATNLPLGEVQFVQCGHRWIGNAITQRFYGAGPQRYVSYDAISKAMTQARLFCANHKLSSFAMPAIGAGLGGGNWNVIAAIIEAELPDVDVKVYVID